ncbi:hypothetical protein NSPZN2_80080 [Nitrospira defluvii]|uniref:Uncharacterized protein n=1 Tax=Nitrospira defluvii TaxID=330214 RepID=A0ABM8SCP4_9BACT|nr:hypothetical protein NSPZN2_80080 [Nitrospira defluvii]
MRVICGLHAAQQALTMAFLQPLTAEGLRGLRKPEGPTIHRPFDHPSRAYVFDRVAHRQGDDCSPMLDGGLHHLTNHGVRQEWPYRIVHKDNLRLRVHFRQGMADGILPLLPTRHHLGNLGKVPRRHDVIEAILTFGLRDGQDDLVDDRRSLEHGERLRQDGAATKGEKLLRDVASHPKATSGRGNQRHCSRPCLYRIRFTNRHRSTHRQGKRNRRGDISADQPIDVGDRAEPVRRPSCSPCYPRAT